MGGVGVLKNRESHWCTYRITTAHGAKWVPSSLSALTTRASSSLLLRNPVLVKNKAWNCSGWRETRNRADRTFISHKCWIGSVLQLLLLSKFSCFPFFDIHLINLNWVWTQHIFAQDKSLECCVFLVHFKPYKPASLLIIVSLTLTIVTLI